LYGSKPPTDVLHHLVGLRVQWKKSRCYTFCFDTAKSKHACS
jgi:hypothetical protein